MASRRSSFSRNAWKRKSGVVSITTCHPSRLSNTEERVRLSCGSLEWQTRQGHPLVGTPIDVPEPITVSRREEGRAGSEEDPVSQRLRVAPWLFPASLWP